MGFTVQAILRRVPIVVAPALGGLAIATLGVRDGVRLGLAATIALALLTLIVASRVRIPPAITSGPANILGIWRSLPITFRRLLLSDIFIRTCEGLVDVFIVLYVTNIVGLGTARFGFLVGVQTVTAIAVYIPAARIADRTGRKPFVVATFLAFSLFPIAIISAHGFASLILAFVVGGLRCHEQPRTNA